ncbi:branched-chain amino acid transport system substrate-binding protein [Pseudonocardia ammonioxydans]|uniref:Branched-chain amino acid transport system substrate-binding protein n=1 Tax=Pseudonocardia ammonioxydans TaxID=260086 RepID=A0A1I5F193_PSUAM|nr:ABC transporter substrate-binding protein [Pseudonocardia ammonioxydans]SFO17399.1 branched-chain amino acid transport system substrate-binding protein [Pseudonocardia ammonioxydans]
MTTPGGSRSTWSGAAFTVQVRPDGRLGLTDRGTHSDVPPQLHRIASAMRHTDLRECRFHWRAPRSARLCRVSLTARAELGFDHVELSGDPVEQLPGGLSTRELEVLTMLVVGLSNAEVAGELGITQRTAATHVTHLMQKLGTPTRTAAATRALDTGLLCVPLPGSAEHYAGLSVGRLLAAASSDAAAPSGEPRREVPRPRRPEPRRELVVGAALPLTGTGSDDGREMINGLQLAIEEINAAGGVRGRRVRAAVRDVEVTSSTSVRTAFESLARGGVDILTSGYLAAQEIGHETAATTGVPYLHAATSGAMEQMVRDDLGRFGRVFQVCASDTEYASRFVSFMTSVREQGHWGIASDRLVIVVRPWHGVDFGIDRARTVADRQGWSLDVVPVGRAGDGDGWARAMGAAVREPAAAVMIGSFFVDDAVRAVTALHERGAPALPYSIYAPSVPAFRHRLGRLAEGVVWATTTGTYSDRPGRAFARRYTDRFGAAPGRSHAGLAYDRMQRIARAWSACGDLSDADAIATHLRAEPYRGVNGTYNFDTPGQVALGVDEHGDPSLAQPQLIYQVQDGRQVIINGGPFRTGEFRLPAHLQRR